MKALYFDKRNKQSASPEAYLGASQKSLTRLSDTSLSTVSYWYYFHFMWSLLFTSAMGRTRTCPLKKDSDTDFFLRILENF